MIPADCWHDNGDGTAWHVFDPNMACDANMEPWPDLDRWCGTCRGLQHVPDDDNLSDVDCPDCFNGRHAFTVGVEDDPIPSMAQLLGDEDPPQATRITLTVAVRPGMVLQIDTDESSCDGQSLHVVMWDDGYTMLCPGPDITLPPAAKPGDWAVLLDIKEDW